ITTDKAGGTYNKTIVHGVRVKAQELVFVTGQVAVPPGMEPAGDPTAPVEFGTIEEQTVRVCENIKAILEEAGSSLEHIVERNVYFVHTGDYVPIVTVLERYFPKMASTGVQIAALVPPSARIEIEVIAVVPE